ncbi:MAG: 1-deoxy-D-xylulose-5-phosphate reductoisomerase [Gemmatimonadetes bacterium]|nr:1-deoxy-D-xylulose-5-phosphate reductoisomerase [Gemmatimonadota bacterium]
MKKRIVVLGSSGSIGRSTLDVVRAWPDRFEVVGLGNGSQWETMLEQVREFRPSFVAVADVEAALALREALGVDEGPEILSGSDAAAEVATAPGADLVVNGLVGSRGLVPTLAALSAGTTVAIANKEALVVGGELVKSTAEQSGAKILPLDSELSAIHQCLRGNSERAVRRVILTASGGPFRRLPREEFASIRAEDALAHPTWDMGPKITVDSATLMNKGLEVIETHHYFDLPYDRIDVVVHPQSIVHSFVEYVDHSMMAQISTPDMRLPIQYALLHPERLPSNVAPLDLAGAGRLDFEEPDESRFPCLRLAREAGRTGGLAPATLNAANEVAVEAFLAGEIRFTDIPGVIEACLERADVDQPATVENFQQADGLTRDEARRQVEARREKSRL